MNKIKNIWDNKQLIIEGIKNKLFTKQHIEDVYKERLEICRGCSYLDIQGDDCTVPGTNPCCGKCGCSLSFKLRSLASSCPLDEPKWSAITDIDTANEIKKQISELLKK